MWTLLLMAATARSAPVIDVGIVPGCPTEADGTLSPCLWRRAIWAHHTWASGVTDVLIVSGNAVHTPFVEALALQQALVALGVPAERVLVEPQALHTDENIAYALRIVQRGGHDSVAVISDGFQTGGSCGMVRSWTDGTIACVPVPMDTTLVHARLQLPLPAVRVAPDPDWIPLSERERRIAELLGIPRRPSSAWVYLRGSLLAIVDMSRPPPLLE